MQNTAMNRPVDPDSVRLKAYELWVSGGKREGVEVQNWLDAERILRSTETTVTTYTAKATAKPVAVASMTDVSANAKPASHDASRAQSSPPASETKPVASVSSIPVATAREAAAVAPAVSEHPTTNKTHSKNSAKGSGRKR